MKKIVALALCFFLLGIPVSASNGLALSVAAPQTVENGSEIELVYSIDSVPAKGLCGLDLEIGFDKSKVELVSATIIGFPENASWQAVGHVSGGTYMLHVFDDYEGEAPVSLYSGSAAKITVKFRALSNAVGAAKFTTSAHGAVMGCYFEGGATHSYIGTGGDASVWIYGYVENCVDGAYYIKDGTVCVLPGLTAAQIKEGVLSVKDKNGAEKSADNVLTAGDVLDFGTGYKQSTVTVLSDMNNDGRLTTNDYLLLKKLIKEGGTVTGNALKVSDINMDGVVTSADAVCVAKLLKGEAFVLK